MNTVKVETSEPVVTNAAGSIYLDSEGDFYILGRIADDWVAICLADGNYWRIPHSDLGYATGGLTLVAKEAEIIIKIRRKDAPSGD